MTEVAVINASPLIFLSRGQHLDLLSAFATRFVVPEPVAHEIFRKGSADVTAKAIADAKWIEVLPSPTVPPCVLEWGLGAGESAVVAFALTQRNSLAVIDDLAGRKCAASLGIPVRGTVGIVLAAKNRGTIPSARGVMEDLIRAGLYLSRPVLDAALRLVGE